ncbi:protein ENHANCED DOWNY MILDEW 2-like isoform X1 [Triticum urartu]|uniref:Protein ENHANCED DOWNY MILDEW 2-like n=2 Tax=Triticum urartu TaxID=4572 RepID=A0A8R7QY43_TRIUA|nr:protein ENHANCED DOWNY MILDEW 2-like isoform X1 [Triticum urartu]XP_048540854.1 protein ENHANCED DOWNY MILDEW 2-like isoform X1 [Triticum urartu]XP_048540855.1 protein ENHANCED DOWNY MILDEW 2-like isoform X1 [Triticum urartu]XP_048540856.1 protein ENHANCED DOWNY MILDEW 2-like isoform X1 [Triticum urartu]XP_048540857.1 protein ENHANCED DOWNY MILDEW 2-like isoform X1 [Triticum urartu]
MAEIADEDSSTGIDLICALCDNGGEIASCEGKCLRSFHATKDASEDCKTLGYTRNQFDAMKVFLCKNCEHERYQCFACHRLSSAKTNPPEVFPCASASCGHFYHAKCVAQLLFPENEAKATEYTARIINGAKFACPVHKCDVCKYGENKEVKELQFAVCRRCPKSYHRRCLPRKIVFDDVIENGVCLFQRAWDGLLPKNRILIYCLKHNIDPKLRTPLRDHIKFPDDPITKKSSNVNGLRRVKIRRLDDCLPVPSSSSKRPLGTSTCSSSINSIAKRKKEHLPGGTKHPSMQKSVMSVIPISTFPEVDINTATRIYDFAQKASSNITIEDVQKQLVVSSTYTSFMKNTDKVTLGKVERSVEAVKTAVHMLESGADIEEAKDVCSPYDLFQLAKWKNKLNIYLAPFLHGTRYTSYGRHFTKLDKLEKIVDKLQWYVQSGDMVVDFCCGSNDFSTLLKEKLEASEKNCFYKNYDLIQPKNDFNFERRDWMTVQPDELPAGSRLIMGLNPPFGFKASLANQFINKALSFKPKLIILIVPKETERLDKKYPPYELIWEDSNQLAGKSFYLPGSFDADNKQMDQWNLSPPPLSLWSRSDFAQKHNEIAKSKGHLCSRRPCYNDSQRDIAGNAYMSTSGDLEMGSSEGEACIPDEEMQGERQAEASVIDQLLADTYHDTTSSPGDYWTDTNGRSGQPRNYDTPGGNDPPTHEYFAVRAAESDMSISLSGRSASRNQNQTVSTSDHEPTNDHVASVSAKQPTDPADCDEVTSADAQHGLGDPPSAPENAAGVQYRILEDSPPEEGQLTPEEAQLNDLSSTDGNAAGVQMLEESPLEADAPVAAANLPLAHTFPGLQFASAPTWPGCYAAREVLSRGMGYPTFHQGASYNLLEK